MSEANDVDSPRSLRSHIQNLNVWKRGEQRAPHKPLLILYTLGKMEAGQRWLPFVEVDKELRRLLIDFGPARKRQHPEYPFWRLQNDGIWTVRHDEPLTRRESNTDPLKSELLAQDVEGGFSEDVWQVFSDNESLRHYTARLLLDEHFQPSFHAELLNAVGLDLTIPSAKRRRDPDFRAAVLRAYSRECAVCGFDLQLGKKQLALEAAHIQWHNHQGPDQVDNGIALCALHHKMFDKGALHITSDLQLLVSEAVHGSDPHLNRLRNLHGKEIRSPQRTTYSPKEEFTTWHVNEVFRGPPRA